MDTSVNSITDSDLNDCFGEIKSVQLGGIVQRTLVNKIAKAENKMTEKFQEICVKHNVEEILNSGENFSIQKKSKISSDSYDKNDNTVLIGLKEIANELKQKELEEITSAIKKLEGDIKKQNDISNRLKNQIKNEVAAATEESKKMQLAAAQFNDQ